MRASGNWASKPLREGAVNALHSQMRRLHDQIGSAQIGMCDSEVLTFICNVVSKAGEDGWQAYGQTNTIKTEFPELNEDTIMCAMHAIRQLGFNIADGVFTVEAKERARTAQHSQLSWTERLTAIQIEISREHFRHVDMVDDAKAEELRAYLRNQGILNRSEVAKCSRRLFEKVCRVDANTRRWDDVSTAVQNATSPLLEFRVEQRTIIHAINAVYAHGFDLHRCVFSAEMVNERADDMSTDDQRPIQSKRPSLLEPY